MEDTVAYSDEDDDPDSDYYDDQGRPLGEVAAQPFIHCYQCNSLTDPGCAETEKVFSMKGKYLKLCPRLKEKGAGGEKVAVGCWKLSQTVSYSQGPCKSLSLRT